MTPDSGKPEAADLCDASDLVTQAPAPLAVDLFCGLGGWSEALLAEGYQVIGFDIERHEYGPHRYPGQLVIQDVLTLHGSQFRDAALIVASPPCQAYSYRSMPWKRAKALPPPDNTLFDACFRIQREACEAAGHHIPLIVENVRGAQKWVGRSRWNFGSFHLWGDVPALMPITFKGKGVKVGGLDWKHPSDPRHRPGQAFNPAAQGSIREGTKVSSFRFDGSGGSFQTASVEHQKNAGGSWFKISHNNVPHSRGDAIKGEGGSWFGPGNKSLMRQHGSKSSARKAASALIAKIPQPLAAHIARTFYPSGATP